MISPRIRKLLGSAVIMLFLGAYIWLASTLSDRLPNSGLLRFVFYAVAGLGWGVPILPVISWMNRADGRSDRI